MNPILLVPGEKRSNLDFGLLVSCATAVGAATLFLTPKVGACGTQHYLLFYFLGGMLRGAIRAVWPFRNPSDAIPAAAMILHVLVFLLPATIWYFKGPRKLYVAGLLVWTGLYVVSYLFGIPTTDCP